MLRPTKYTDLSTCVLRIASEILAELQTVRRIGVDECNTLMQVRVGEDARFNFLPALDLLFILGRLDYELDSDQLVLTPASDDGGEA